MSWKDDVYQLMFTFYTEPQVLEILVKLEQEVVASKLLSREEHRPLMAKHMWNFSNLSNSLFMRPLNKVNESFDSDEPIKPYELVI